MKCDICGEVNDAVEIHMCKQCANKFSDNVNCIKRDLAIYKRALELACESVGDGIVYKDIGTNKELNAEELEQMFIHQVGMENELKEWKKNR